MFQNSAYVRQKYHSKFFLRGEIAIQKLWHHQHWEDVIVICFDCLNNMALLQQIEIENKNKI